MESVKILLIEDDEDDYIIVKDSLSKVENTRYDLDWVRNFNDAVNKDFGNTYDACLLDFRLGMKNGLAVLKKLKESDFNAPVIMLTGQGSRDVDIDAMKLGADDYIEKDQLNSSLLERSIRYSIDRFRNIRRLRESERKLRRLSAKIIQAQEDERKYIAKELHDSIGSNLTAIKLMLETNKITLAMQPPISEFPIEKILTTVLDTIEEADRITRNLRPEALDKLGIVPSLRSVIRQFSEINKKIRVSVDFNVTEQNVPDPLKITIFRVVQEALNNIAKYSGADQVKVQFKHIDHTLELTISDNGKGFDAAKPGVSAGLHSGMGLDGMRERVDLSDGRFEVNSRINEGTVIHAIWNIKEP